MLSERASVYRAVLQQLRQSIQPPRRVNPTIVAYFRSVAEKANDVHVRRDFENAANFLRAQREHKRLLAKYDPLFDLTAQERVAATAHRVGLNMPKIGS